MHHTKGLGISSQPLFFTGKTNVTNCFESGCNYQET